MTDPKDIKSDPGAEADDVLDHALRERPIADDDFDFDDELNDDSAAPDSSFETEQPEDYSSHAADNDGEDYVLYSEVRPHLELLVELQEQRDKMIDILLYARDRVSSPAVAARMDDNMSQLGITVIVPAVGDVFDPARHEASATVLTDAADQQGTIAEVELAGYTDGDRMVRHPIVTVYTTEQPERS